jgi:hypothetical protein
MFTRFSLAVAAIIPILASPAAAQDDPARVVRSLLEGSENESSERVMTRRLFDAWNQMRRRNPGCEELPGLSAYLSGSQDASGRMRVTVVSRDNRRARLTVGPRGEAQTVTMFKEAALWKIDNVCFDGECYRDRLQNYRCGD